jgi:hypothetical protein
MLFLPHIGEFAPWIGQNTGLIISVAVVFLGLGALLSFMGYIAALEQAAPPH